ncbi:hypothetical protein DDR33_25060 [Pararcticibacter amylolyticus]|uniref:Uncharacterized protein n=1 Tax=Pararcticibacter amylolyticus TaxID=2173175 RepID=A0A2U2P9C8_9SPHI|nr:hypothetical protein DDR33_25060 [Pararcticibacter amylolyticus]
MKNISLEQIVKEKMLDSKASSDVLYSDISQQSYILKYKLDRLNLVSDISLSMRGNNIERVIKNDSVICYSLKFISFSLKIDKDADVDILAQSGTNEDFRGEPVPVNLLFLKRNKSVYFVILAVNDRHHSLTSNFLYELMDI